MQTKMKYAPLLLIPVFILLTVWLAARQKASVPYTYDDIPRQYVIGEITSVSEKDASIELLLDNGEPASVTMTTRGKPQIYEVAGATVKPANFSRLKPGQTIQCDIRLSVTLEKINSFHDCRQIFILPDAGTA